LILFLISESLTVVSGPKGDNDALSRSIATLCIAGTLFKLLSLLAACRLVSLLDWLDEGHIFHLPPNSGLLNWSKIAPPAHLYQLEATVPGIDLSVDLGIMKTSATLIQCFRNL
jgi:hypothetical protein